MLATLEIGPKTAHYTFEQMLVVILRILSIGMGPTRTFCTDVIDVTDVTDVTDGAEIIARVRHATAK